MNEIRIIGYDIALAHTSFQLYKNINFKIGIVTPTLDFRHFMYDNLIGYLDLSNHIKIDKLSKFKIRLSNGNEVFCNSQYQIEYLFRHYKFNMIFYLNNFLSTKIKNILMSCLILEPKVLYVVSGSPINT